MKIIDVPGTQDLEPCLTNVLYPTLYYTTLYEAKQAEFWTLTVVHHSTLLQLRLSSRFTLLLAVRMHTSCGNSYLPSRPWDQVVKPTPLGIVPVASQPWLAIQAHNLQPLPSVEMFFKNLQTPDD